MLRLIDVRALVMELVEGPTLAERIGEQAMPLEEALPIANWRGGTHRQVRVSEVSQRLVAGWEVRLL
jgi:hypothetical protein